jgi:inhibitor of cysteine peptidase
MLKIFLSIFVYSILISSYPLMVSGCGSSPVVKVKDADNGAQKVMKVGQLLHVSLESNPTTGFSWEALEADDSILQMQGGAKFYANDNRTEDLAGAGGTDNFYFIAVDEGERVLEFVYRRAWEDAQPDRAFTVYVSVR